MSAVTVDSVKRDLRIIHDDDDTLLQELIDAAERACLNFLDIDALPVVDEEKSSEPVVEMDVQFGVRLLVRSMYEETDPARLSALRSAAETMWMPYRKGLGV